MQFFMRFLSRSPMQLLSQVLTSGDFLFDSGATFALICCDFPKIAAKLHQVSNMFETSATSRTLTSLFILATSGRSSQNGNRLLNELGSRPANTINTCEKSRLSSEKKKMATVISDVIPLYVDVLLDGMI